ncbi:MAG: DUF4358 domain-containing protein [Holdemania massiliensis]
MASDTRADQIAVFEVAHPDQARKVIESEFEAMQQQNANYFPEEAAKLKQACIMNKGRSLRWLSVKGDAVCSAGLE